MRFLSLFLAAVMGLGVAVVTVDAGDPILEAARRERARRAAIRKRRAQRKKKPAVLDNDAIRHSRGTLSKPSEVHRSAEPASGDDKKAKKENSEQQLWRDRMQRARAAVADAKQEVVDLNGRINQLRRDASAIDDPQVRYQKDQERIVAENSMTAAQQAVKDAEQAIEDLQTEARRAGVPRGWVR